MWQVERRKMKKTFVIKNADTKKDGKKIDRKYKITGSSSTEMTSSAGRTYKLPVYEEVGR